MKKEAYPHYVLGLHTIYSLLAKRRGLSLDYPLGQSCGKPFNEVNQYDVLTKALEIFEAADKPGHIEVLELDWGSRTGKFKLVPLQLLIFDNRVIHRPNFNIPRIETQPLNQGL